ncbi:MAG: hypothetical protein SFY66_05175 [Oculatellaceae cyanobacterium bins.114]|nr:hypothetical protein [Oculatellaceae cyanobacterium bins.114]
MKTFQELTVGVFVIYIALAVMTGGFANAAMILVFSVICTAGIALVLWIPLCIGVGKLGLMVARAIARSIGASSQNAPLTDSSDRPRTGQPPQSSSSITDTLAQTLETNNRLAIKDYIYRARRLDHSYERIFNQLSHQGWSEAEINQAYQTVIQEG